MNVTLYSKLNPEMAVIAMTNGVPGVACRADGLPYTGLKVKCSMSSIKCRKALPFFLHHLEGVPPCSIALLDHTRKS